jgi:hypothetical protein
MSPDYDLENDDDIAPRARASEIGWLFYSELRPTLRRNRENSCGTHRSAFESAMHAPNYKAARSTSTKLAPNFTRMRARLADPRTQSLWHALILT